MLKEASESVYRSYRNGEHTESTIASTAGMSSTSQGGSNVTREICARASGSECLTRKACRPHPAGRRTTFGKYRVKNDTNAARCTGRSR